MIKKTTGIFGLAILLAALPGTILAQDAKTVLSNAAKAMGAENLKTMILIVTDVKPNAPVNIQPQQQTQGGAGTATQP